MKINQFVVGLFGGLLVSGAMAVGAQAQSNFRQSLECVSNGSLTACASFQVETLWLPGGGTQVALRVQNRDVDQGYQALLVSLGLVAPELGTVSFSGANRIAVEGDAFIDPNGSYSDQDVLDEWQFSEYQQPGGGTSLEFGATGTKKDNGTGSPKAGIEGCYGTTPQVGSLVTCDNAAADGSGSNSGWVVFNFWTSEQWYASQAELSFRYMQVDVEGSLTCPDGSLTCTTEVVPEPVTVVLLGSGLLALALVARRRNRLGATEAD